MICRGLKSGLRDVQFFRSEGRLSSRVSNLVDEIGSDQNFSLVLVYNGPIMVVGNLGGSALTFS